MIWKLIINYQRETRLSNYVYPIKNKKSYRRNPAAIRRQFRLLARIVIRRSPNSARVKSGQGLSLILIKVLDYSRGTEIIICGKLAVYFLAAIPRRRNEQEGQPWASVLRRIPRTMARMKNRQDLERRQVCELYGFGLIYKGFRQPGMESVPVVNHGMRLGLLWDSESGSWIFPFEYYNAKAEFER